MEASRTPGREPGPDGPRPRAILTLAVIGAIVGLAVSTTSEASYEARAVIGVTDLLAIATGESAEEGGLATQTALAGQSTEVIDEVAGTVPAGLTPEQLREATRVSRQGDADVVVLAEAESAELAATLADRLAEETARATRRDQRQALDEAAESLAAEAAEVLEEERAVLEGALARVEAALAAGGGVEVVSEASLPAEPEGPGAARAMAVGTALGALAGLVLLLVRGRIGLPEGLRPPRRAPAPAPASETKPAAPRDKTLPLEVAELAAIAAPRILADQALALGSDLDPRSLSELQELPHRAGAALGRTVARLGVIDAARGAGGQDVALAVGAATVAGGREALLAEVGAGEPGLAQRLGINRTPGLDEYFRGDAAPGEVLQAVQVGADSSDGLRLACVTRGSRPPVSVHERLGGFIDQVSRAYDLVIVDVGYPGRSRAPLEALRSVDAVLVVAHTGERYRIRRLRSAIADVAGEDTPLGLVLVSDR